MITIEELTDEDVGRRLVWEIGPGVEQPGQLLSWLRDKIIIALPMPGTNMCKPVEVAPEEVRWAHDKMRRAG